MLIKCLLLEPHHFGSIDFSVLRVIALYSAVADAGLCNLLGLALIVMAGLTRLTIAKTKIAIKFALLCHGVLIIHFCFLSALIEHQYLFVGTLYKTLDK